MNKGRFSLSLAVQDLVVSREFYAKLGFDVYPAEDSWDAEFKKTYNVNWVILTDGDTKLGLFQGMFEKNSLTWNPTDVRAVQAELKASGIELMTEADPETTGPAHVVLQDPDGNPILLDQH